MAWGKGELTAEDLKKAGLDPADLAELKANGVKKTDIETLKTELGTSLTTSMTELITNQFKELEGKLKPVNNNNNNNNNNDNQVDENTEFLSDPAGFMNKKLNQSAAFTLVQATKMRMDLALDRAKSNLKGFKNTKLSDEILQEWNTYTPEVCAMWRDKDGKPNFDPDSMLKKVHDMVIGRHADEINHDTNKREGVYNLVASGSGGGGGGGVTSNDEHKKTPEELMTDEDKAMAARYGMTPKQWVEADGEKYQKVEDEIVVGGN